MQLKKQLKSLFGYDDFRINQREIITNLMNGNNTLVLKATGGGKSLLFQLPTLVNNWRCVVVTPTIALMNDHVKELTQLPAYEQGEFKVFALNSDTSAKNKRLIREELEKGNFNFLFISPETLTSRTNGILEILERIGIDLLVIDEAHLTVEWSQFRGAYLWIKYAIERIKPFVVMALTATVNKDSQAFLQNEFLIDTVFKDSFNRPNMNIYFIEKESDFSVGGRIISYIKKNPNKKGIIYTNTTKKVNELHEFLVSKGVSCGKYHGGLSSTQKNNEKAINQDGFINNEFNWLVGTDAFGMGINIPNIDCVISECLPPSIPIMWQWFGRGGRDGREFFACCYYNSNDIDNWLFIQKNKKTGENSPRDIDNLALVYDVVTENAVCTKQLILICLGEGSLSNCGKCNYCRKIKNNG